MSGLFDLLFLALVLWWVFRAVGGRAGRKDGGEVPPTGRPEAGTREPRRGAGADAEAHEAAPSAAGPAGLRDRLVEAARQWEAEQRRTLEEARLESERLREAEEARQRAALRRRLEAERPEERPPGPTRRSGPAAEGASPALPGAVGTGKEAERLAVARPARARPARAPLTRAARWGRRGERARRAGWPDLDHLPEPAQAVVHREILGPPRALREWRPEG